DEIANQQEGVVNPRWCFSSGARVIVATFALSTVLATTGRAQPAASSGTTPVGLFYELSGSGDPFVFIHAFSIDRRTWDPQVATFQTSSSWFGASCAATAS